MRALSIEKYGNTYWFSMATMATRTLLNITS